MTQEFPTLVEDPDEQPVFERLSAPLDMLRSVCERLLKREIPLSRERLDGLFAHVKGAVGEVLDFAQDEVGRGLTRLAEADQDLRKELGKAGPPEAATAVQAEFEAGRRQIEAGLKMIKETFFSATSFTELEASQNSLVVAQAQLEEGFAQLETALLRSGDAGLLEVGTSPAAPEVSNALDYLADCLEDLQDHLEDERPEHIHQALANLDKTRALLEQALVRLEKAAGE